MMSEIKQPSPSTILCPDCDTRVYRPKMDILFEGGKITFFVETYTCKNCGTIVVLKQKNVNSE